MDIRKRIWAAIDVAKSKGINVAPGGWGVYAYPKDVWELRNTDSITTACFNTCCPLGAVLLGNRNYDYSSRVTAVAELLGVENWWVWAFIDGVDGHVTEVTPVSPIPDIDFPLAEEAYNLGREFRAALGGK